METVFTRKIEIWDEHMNTYHIYSVDRDNIKNLAAQLDLYIQSLQNKFDIEIFKKFIVFIETCNTSFSRYKLYELIEDEENENRIKKFFESIQNLSREIHKMRLKFPKLFEIISYQLLLLDNFSYRSYYVLEHPSSIEDYDYKCLRMNLLNLDIEVDESLTTSDILELIEENVKDEENDDEDEEDTELDFCPQELYDYPIHPSILKELINELITTDKDVKKISLILYCDCYTQYLSRQKLEQPYLDDLKKLNNLLVVQERMISKYNKNYESILQWYKDNTSIYTRIEPTEFNDIEMFIVALFDTFLKKRDIYFFNDLKVIFNSYSTDDKETCMFIVNDLMKVLDRYKMSKEIECIKHIVNEKNVVDFVSNLFTCFEMRISEDKDGEFFGKDFGKDINGFNRNSD